MSSNEDFVRASLNGDAVEAQNHFNSLLNARVADKIDAMRSDVAANLVNPQRGSDETNQE